MQVRRGDAKNGSWYLNVAQAGRYRFELRRWPRESQLRLDDSVPETRVTDGVFIAGPAMPIRQASIRIADHQAKAAADNSGRFVEFELDLQPGPTQLQTWMRDADGNELCGAYYVYVERL